MTQYIQTEGGTQPGSPWLGEPITCTLCGKEEPPCFVDGQHDVSPHSRWIIMCIPCFKLQGKGIGNGLGQKYCKKQ